MHKTVSIGLPDWLKPLIKKLSITPGEPAATQLQKAEHLANALAPNTRRMYSIILFVQGLAVMAPLFWFVVMRDAVPAAATAYFITLCVLLMAVVLWWVRWRGMQHTWARTRMLAEIARSHLNSVSIHSKATATALSGAPMLAAIANYLQPSSAEHPASNSHWKEAADVYCTQRINDQLAYYQSKRAEALKHRQRLSKTVTLAVDAALFLAIAGLFLALRDPSLSWLTWSGSDYVLAFVGALLPLVAILAQLRGAYLELNRRIGRYAQQIEFLTVQHQAMTRLNGSEEVMGLVSQVEQNLLAEVVEWFYQTENTEPYYRSSSSRDRDTADKPSLSASATGVVQRIVSLVGIGFGFMGRVIFGRVLVIALSVVVTTALINYQRAPNDPTIHAQLILNEGELLTPTADGLQLWQANQAARENGLVVIAHGLHDGVDRASESDHWMRQLASAIANKRANAPVQVMLVDWRSAAKPSAQHQQALDSIAMDALGLPDELKAMLNDVAMIRPQGERIGELVGFKLARALRNKQLAQGQPIHLIGHSAGGFVVLNAAMVLLDLGIAPETLRVTMLDTPLPVADDIAKVAKSVPVDFYVTSALAVGVPNQGLATHYWKKVLQPPAHIDRYTGAHSYAHQWFIQSVKNEDSEGFSRSPFAKSN